MADRAASTFVRPPQITYPILPGAYFQNQDVSSIFREFFYWSGYTRTDVRSDGIKECKDIFLDLFKVIFLLFTMGFITIQPQFGMIFLAFSKHQTVPNPSIATTVNLRWGVSGSRKWEKKTWVVSEIWWSLTRHPVLSKWLVTRIYKQVRSFWKGSHNPIFRWLTNHNHLLTGILQVATPHEVLTSSVQSIWSLCFFWCLVSPSCQFWWRMSR